MHEIVFGHTLCSFLRIDERSIFERQWTIDIDTGIGDYVTFASTIPNATIW
jgi:hypothetical protein